MIEYSSYEGEGQAEGSTAMLMEMLYEADQSASAQWVEDPQGFGRIRYSETDPFLIIGRIQKFQYGWSWEATSLTGEKRRRSDYASFEAAVRHADEWINGWVA
jgi:hypothetical protein